MRVSMARLLLSRRLGSGLRRNDVCDCALPYACAASPASVSAALSADPFIPETEEAMTEIARFLMRRLAA